MTPQRRHTPEFSPEQFDELKQRGTVTITDGNGRMLHLANIEGLLSKTSNTRAMLWQTLVLIVVSVGAVWRAAFWYRDLRDQINGINVALVQRTTDRWWGAAEAISDQVRATKDPTYAKCALTASEIVDIQNTVRARLLAEQQ
jgi:hypothetical protein